MVEKNKGFTLVELLIVMSIMAIIAVVTLPNFFSSRYRYSINKDAEGLAYGIRTAISNSQTQLNGSRWGIRLGNNTSTGGYYYQLWYGTSTYAYGTPSTLTPLDQGVSFSGIPLGFAVDICFVQISGLPVDCSTGLGTSTAITLSAIGGQQTVVTVNANGTVNY